LNYLLDANTFIEAKNRYYNMTVCPAYWTWTLRKYAGRDVASISMVGDELKRGDDELAEWAKNNPDLFISVDDDATQSCFIHVANHLRTIRCALAKHFCHALQNGSAVCTGGMSAINATPFSGRRLFRLPTIKRKFVRG
jgi:hypothetical protein